MPQTTRSDTPAERTLAEHRALHALLQEIQEAAADPGGAGEPLVARLGTLRDQLDAHFDGEEESGLFEQIQELAPEQAHECARLCDQHRDLLNQLDELRDASAETRASEAWTRGVRELLVQLDEHESRENELLTRVLDGSMEAQD